MLQVVYRLVLSSQFSCPLGAGMLTRTFVVFFSILLGFAATDVAGAQGRRVALVIGNAKYQNTPALTNSWE